MFIFGALEDEKYKRSVFYKYAKLLRYRNETPSLKGISRNCEYPYFILIIQK